MYTLRNKRVWVAGHRGLVGAAVVRRLAREDCVVQTIARADCDLRVTSAVDGWVRKARPHAIFLAAARVGGILANDTRPGEFIYDNLMIQSNVIEAARRYGVERLLFLGSSCIYPRLAPQPIVEDALLTGPLEPTNQWYAIAKINGIKLCQAYRRQYGCDFVSAMPTNLYGPGDNFDLLASHVVPALIAKAHRANLVGAPAMTVWGSGRPLRELLYVDDAADGLVFLMKHYFDEAPINLGSGEEVSIADLATLVCRVVGYDGKVDFDLTRPDGTPRKALDGRRIVRMGWRAEIPLAQGLAETYRWYLRHARLADAPALADARA